MASTTTTFRTTTGRAFRRILPWALALAVATCTDDQNGPSAGGTGYFSFRPVYGISNSLSQFGIVADSVHITLTRPVNEVVLDTTLFFPPDSSALHLALPVHLTQSPETLSAVIEISSGGTLLFVDSVDVQVLDGPPNPANIPTVVLDYVGPGQNVAAITIAPADTTIVLGDTVFFTSTAVDSSAQPVASFFTAWKTSDTTVAKINAQGRLIAPNLRGSVRVIGYTPTGIADTTLVTFAPVPVIVTADSGNAQSGLVGDSLATLFVARVKGADSLGISGIAVRFTAVTAGGAVRDTQTLVTDLQGRVRTRAVLGTTAGAYSYTATVVGTALTRTFTATATAGAASTIAISAGNAQTDSAGRLLPLPLTVRVADAFNNPVTGAKVYWTRPVGTGTRSADSSFTNASGLASITYTLGNVGLDSVRAALAGTSAFVSFAETAVNGVPATVAKTFGDAQSDTVGRLLTDSLVVIVTSATAKPVVGTPVVWTVLRGGATSDDTVFTDAAGRAAVAYTAGTLPGIDSVRAQAGAASAIFTETAATGAASTLLLVSGNAQTDTIGKLLPLPFVVRAQDAFGNNVAGTPVVWAVAAGTGSLSADTVLTDGAGLASVTYVLGPTPGTDTISATLACGCITVPFTATGLVAAPAAIQIFFGNTQTAVAGSTLPDSLVATVLDGSSNPVVSAQVIWTVLRGGSVAQDTTYSDGSGHVSALYTAGTLTGVDSIRVQALVGGASAIFTETITADLPVSIFAVSGDGQSDTTGLFLPLPLVVEVQDQFNNPVPGTAVAFTRIAGSGAPVADTVVTDALGRASTSYQLGATPGTDTVRAELVATGGIVDFTATALQAAPASIVTVQGDSQTIVVNTVADTFAVLVRDGANNPVVGAKVNWAFIPAQGNFTEILPAGILQSYTDSLGVARGIYTAGTQAGTIRVEAQVGPHIDSIFVFAVPAAPSAIAIQSGDLQSDTVGRAIPLPFVARVRDAYGNPVAGAMVLFTRIAGSGTLFADSVATNASGDAIVGYQFGFVPGVDTIRATLSGTAAFVDFEATAIPELPATITARSGSGQTAVVTAALTDSLEVEVLDNVDIAWVKGTVVWTTTLGGLVLSTDTTTTDTLGRTFVHVTAGTTAGSFTVYARALGLADSAAFTVNVLPDAAVSITESVGGGQTDTVGATLATPLSVLVTDQYGNAVPGANVVFVRTAGNGTVVPDTAVSNAAGLAGAAYTFGAIAGTDTIVATLQGTASTVTFTETAVLPVVASVTDFAGDGASDTVGTLLFTPLTVTVRDGGGQPIAGASIVWTVLSGGGTVGPDTTLTDISGNTSTALTLGTLAGTATIEARSVTTGIADTLTVTQVAGAPSAISLVGGDAQVDTTGRTLTAPLIAFVGDAYGNLVVGAAVTFTTISGSGTPSQDTVLSNAVGQAFVNYTLGATPGTDTVRAQLVGTSAFLDFTATAVSGVPSGIIKLLGDNQADTVLSTLTDSLVVQLLDAGATPIPNTWLYWTTAGMTLSADSTLTDLNGKAAVQVTFGSIAVPAVVVVHNVDTTLATVFNLRMKAGTATQITAVAGLGQTGVVDSALPVNFGAFVQDAYGNPADSGVAVTWTNLAGFAAFGLPDTTVTDSTGVAYLTSPLLGPTAGEDSLEARILGQPATALFTATATAGAAGALQYVSGTGQSGTVGNLLASQFNVQVLDGSSNPIAGTWVHWTVTAGNGSFPTDSSLTDGSGVAKITLTLGTIAGVDSAIATVTGVADTVTFYAQANAGPASSLQMLSGDGQAGNVSGTLAAPLVVEVVDQYSNPIAGVTVDFGVASGPGGGFANPSASTDAAGQASTGTVNLAATAGTTIVEATSATLPADTVRFTVIGLPIGTSKSWSGVNDGDFGNATNWLPAGVPDSTDAVYIPAGTLNQPLLDVSRTIGALTLESGTQFDVQGNILTLKGDLIADAPILRTSGHTILAGTGSTAVGHLGAIEVTGDYTLAGTSDVVSNLQVTSGSFDVNGHVLDVNGAIDVSGTGAFIMNSANDSVHVTAPSSWGGSIATGLLTNGVIVFDSDLGVASSQSFRASGSHRTVFAGASAPNVSFGTAALGGNQFQDLDVTSGLTVNSTIAVAGDLRLVGGGVSGSGQTVILGGNLDAPVPSSWDVGITQVEGSPTTFPGQINNDLYITGSADFSIPGSTSVIGNLSMDAGRLSLNGQSLTVSGSTSITGTAQFVTTPSGSAVASFYGPVTWDGSTATGLLNGSELHFHGDLTIPDPDRFRAGGATLVRFLGTAPQTVSMTGAALGGNQFVSVTFGNDSGVTFTTDFAADGLNVLGPVNISAPHTAIIGSVLSTGGGDSLWNVQHTLFSNVSGGGAIPDTMFYDVDFTGTSVLGQPLLVLGNVGITGGQFTMNNGTLIVGGNFDVSGGAEFRELSGSDSVDITGTATWDGATVDGNLTSGILVLRGDLNVPTAGAFQAQPFHGTKLMGDVNRTITMAAASLSGNRFGTVFLVDTLGVTLGSNIAVTGTAYSSGNPGFLVGGGYKVILGDFLSDPAGRWRPDTIEFAGTPANLPTDVFTNVLISGSVDPLSDIHVHGGLEVTGNFRPEHHFIVDGDFSVQGSGLLYMMNLDDSLEVGGDAHFNGSTTSGTLVAGALILRGNLTQESAGNTFQATPLHQTVFAGTGTQAIIFNGTAGSGSNQFGQLIIDNAAGVTANTDIYVDSLAEVRQGTIVGSTATTRFGVLDTTNIGWQIDNTIVTATPVVMMDSLPRNFEFQNSVTLAKPLVAKAGLAVSFGFFTANSFPIRVDSNLTVTGSGLLVMQNAADSVEVFGTAIFNGATSASYLTEGVLVLHHGLTANTGQPTFAATFNHRTHLVGDGAIDLGFLGDGGQFNELTIDPGLTLTVKGEVFVQGNVSKNPGTVTTFNGVNGVRTLHLAGANIDGAVFDSVALAINSLNMPTLNNITMQGQDSIGTSILVRTGGIEGAATWDNVQFPGVYTSGKMVSLEDASPDGFPVRVKMTNSFPLDGTPYEVEINNGDAVYLDWSRLVYQTQPLAVAAAATLAPVELRVVDPDGNTLTSFTGNVTVAIGTNPAGGTLSGTTTVAAVSGVATFSDLAIDNVGAGYTLDGSATGLVTIPSDPFAVNVPLPVGFTTLWTGAVDSDWSNGGNWSTNAAPTPADNVYIPSTYANAPISAAATEVNRLQVAAGAVLTISTSTLTADSSVEAYGLVDGTGNVDFHGPAGDITGHFSSGADITGSYQAVDSVFFNFNLTITGRLEVGGDTVTVTGLLATTNNTGVLAMTSPAASVVVDGPAQFNGGPTTGQLADGTLRISGSLTAGGAYSDAFAPSPSHLTILNGTGTQNVFFAVADSSSGSRFGKLQVGTTGVALMAGRYDALGDLLITNGATLADSAGAGYAGAKMTGFEAHGFTSIDAGGALAVDTLRTRGAIGVAVGGSYSVANTIYYEGTAFPINPAPYDTLILFMDGAASGDMVISGDLRIYNGTGQGNFDLNGHTVAVGGSVDINNGGTLTMRDPADVLNVAGSFFTNGGSTLGRLTNGLLQIAGNFRQAADGSGSAFWADPGHVTRFTGGAGTHSLQFDSPAGAPSDSNNSRFGQLELIGGIDSIIDRVAAGGRTYVSADVQADTAQLANTFAAFDSLVLYPASTQFLVRNLESWNGVDNEAGSAYQVLNTTFYGGSFLPVLPYVNVTVSGTSMTGIGDITALGSFQVGIAGEVGGTTGSLAMGGHTFTIGGPFSVRGFGDFSMGAGDSLDVSGAVTFRGRKIEGNLLGGTLVARSTFEAQGDSVYIADPAHRTVFASPGASTLYVSTTSAEALQFGKLYVLDGDVRTVSSFGTPFYVRDSLVLGSAAGGFDGSGDNLIAQGPIFGVSGSTLTFNQIEVFNTLLTSGSYNVSNTVFNGAGTIPVLPYFNVTVYGTRTLEGNLTLPAGAGLTVSNTGADLTLGGHTLIADFVGAQSLGTITMTDVADTVEVRNGLTLAGGNETGLLTAGVMRVRGALYQGNTYNDSTLVSSGTHRFEFIDSTTAVGVTLSSMDDGRSRFNDVAFYGQGAAISGDAWIDGVITMPDPVSDSVTGTKVRISGTLTDPATQWKVDTTVVRSASTVIPDSVDKHLVFETDFALTHLLGVGGILQIHDTVAIGGYTLRVHNALVVEGNGVLQMTNPTDDVQVDGVALFNGAPTGALMSAGRLTLRSSLMVPGTGSFDATGSHTTVLAGGGTQTIDFTGGAQGYGFHDLELRSTDFNFTYGALAHGSINDSTPAVINISGGDSALVAAQVHLVDATLNDTRLVTGDSLLLGNLTFNFSDPEGKTQLTIRGAGQSVPVDVVGAVFNNVPAAGQLLAVIDTAGGPDPLNVRMFASVPFDGSSLTFTSSNASALWSHLALSGTLPATIDSIIPFGLTVTVVQPDGSSGYSMNGAVDVSLVNGGTATLSGGTTANFDGSNANFFGLVLDGTAVGASLHFAVQGQPMDTLNVGPFNIINPAPVGAVIFDGDAADGLWSSAANWSNDALPAPTDSVFIPGGVSVTLDQANDTIGTLVLGVGAGLNLGGNTLVTTGNVYAGQTITSGTIEVAGAASQISGTLPTLHVTGSVSAVGRTSIFGDLIIEGTGAEFNVGGQFVDVSNTLFTQSGGVFTMDGAADTLYVSSVSLSGGDETGRLTDGLLLIQGSSFDEAGGDPNAFHASGNHTTIFGDGGSSAAVNIGDPYASQFAHVKVQNPNGVDFNESGQGFVRLSGALTVSAGGAVTGDTLRVDGAVTTDASASITLGTLELGATPSLAGSYTVGTTWYLGAGVAIAGAPQGYQALLVTGAANLADTVGARSVTIANGGSLDVNGRTLRTDSLFGNAALGALLMDDPADTVIVTTRAQFNGVTPAIPMTAGYLELHGDLDVSPNYNAFVATAGHVTRFVGAASHVMNFPGEGSATPLGTVVIDSGAVLFNDNSLITGDLILHDGLLADSSQGRNMVVQGSVTGDDGANTEILLGTLTLSGALSWSGTGAHYQPATTEFAGAGQVIPQLPYQGVEVTGTASLLGDASFGQGAVRGIGVLTLGGHRLDVSSGGFLVTDDAHLVMQNGNDSLWVEGLATFQGADATGDLTAGVVRARSLLQQQGPSSSDNGFVQSGTGRVVMLPFDTLRMNPTGPVGSRIRMLDLSQAGDSVWLGNAWIDDSLFNDNPATTAVSYSGADNLVVSGDVRWLAGTLHLDTLAVGGTLNDDTVATSYQVHLTKFIGDSQAIPTGVPYNNVEVYYRAYLVGNLFGFGTDVTVLNTGDLDLNGHTLNIRMFRTFGQGILTMTDPADSLGAQLVRFDGGNTAGHLTAGTILTGDFYQTSANSDSSYAPSGTHALDLYDTGGLPETGAGIHSATGEFNIVRIYGTGTGINDKPKLWNSIAVRDTFAVLGKLDASFYSVDARGAVRFGPGAEVVLAGLAVHDTLDLAPTVTYQVGTTIFGTGAKPIPDISGFASATWSDVVIEGDQTLNAPLNTFNLTVRQNGVLTPAGHAVATSAGFSLLTDARLVMAAGDTVDVGTAFFDGAGSGSDLAGGILRVRNGLGSGNSTNSQTFAPTGMVTEFYGGGTASINIAVNSPSNSFIDTLRVIEGTTIVPSPDLLVMGPALFKDGSTFNGNSASASLDFRGGATVLDTSIVTSSNTVFFGDSLTMASPGNYSVAQTNFYGTDGIPDLPYQTLVIGDVQMTLTHPLTASGQIIITGTTPDATKITLGGFGIEAGTLDISGYARVEMTNPNDTLLSTSNMTFAGEDETGLLTAGTIRVGGDLNQNGFYSAKSLRSDGTEVVFAGASASHLVNFGTPGTGNSYLAGVTIQDGGTMILTSGITTMGLVNVVDGTFDASSISGADAVDLFGGMSVASTGTVSSPGSAILNFYDTLLVAPGGTYNVLETGFTNVDTLPSVTFGNLYLGDGTDIVLAEDLVVSGQLTLTANTPGAQSLTLNGRKVSAGLFATATNGRLVMQNALDSLLVNGDVSFDGADETGFLTAGTIYINNNFTQRATTSTSSGRLDGTKLLFNAVTPMHIVDVLDPQQSTVAGIGGINGSVLGLFLSNSLVSTGDIAHGGVTLVGVPGSTITADSIRATGGVLNINLSKVTTGYFGTAGPVIYTVPTTEIVGNIQVPSFTYDTLILAGRDSIIGLTVTANHVSINDSTYVGPSGTLASNGHLIVDGGGVANRGVLKLDDGTVTVADSFVTQNAGYLASGTGASSISAKNVLFNGGSETTHLTRGTLTVSGNFASGIGTSFDADSLFTVDFTGGGNHTLYLGNTVSQHFGNLSLTASLGSDTLTLSSATFSAYKLSASGNGLLTASPAIATLQVEALNVSGLADSGVSIDQYTLSDQPLTFDDVTFRGFSATARQLTLTDNGTAPAFNFFNVDFDDAAAPDGISGFFLQFTDNDGPSPNLFQLNLYGPDSVAGPAKSNIVSGTVTWLPPS